jgi:signal transduction histidine kinase
MLRNSLATRFSISIIAVAALSIISSLLALYVAYRVGSSMEQMVQENVASVVAAEEVEIALLEQRGFVTSYVLDDGNPRWLKELGDREPAFQTWLVKARSLAITPAERGYLTELDDVFQRYDAIRDLAVERFQEGRVDEAKRLVVNDVRELADEAYLVCEKYLAFNQKMVSTRREVAHRQFLWLTGVVAACVLVTCISGVSLVIYFLRHVLLPLRLLAASAKHAAPLVAEGEDELRTLGFYMRSLMENVSTTRADLERSRQQLEVSERLATVGKLAASVAHEIRNPLSAIKMWLFSIRRATGNAELEPKFEIISEELLRLERIVRDFLQFSRPPEVNVSAQSCSTMVDETLQLLQIKLDDAHIRVEKKISAALPQVNADPEQIRQVFLNVLNNAVQAMPQGGSVEVAAACETYQSQSFVKVSIADHGEGMPPEIQARLFEPFFSTKDEGTGLGLCIAARIMERHGGRLTLETTSSNGTTFAVWLPSA